jgi:hypothetical protein
MITKIVILLGLAAQALTVDLKGPCRIEDACREPVFVGWEQPRPSQNLTCSYRQYRERAAPLGGHLERYFPMTEQIEFSGFFAYTENNLSRLKANVGSAPGDEFNVRLRKTFEKRMLC